MDRSEKSKIYFNVWCCAHQRRYLYRNTPREQREHDTVLMCLNMKDVKWYEYDTEKKRYLS